MTDISLVVHLHAIGNIRMRVYFFIGPCSTVGGKPSGSSRVPKFHCDPPKVHYYLEIGHENEYTFIRQLPLIQ